MADERLAGTIERSELQPNGFRLPFAGQAPPRFFLPIESFFTRTLQRICVLTEPFVSLGFRVTRIDAGQVQMQWTLNGVEVYAATSFNRLPSATLDGLSELLAPLNSALDALGDARRLLLVNAEPEPSAHYDLEYWVVFLPTANPDPAELRSIALPEEIVTEPARFISGSPYASGLAAYASKLARRVLNEDTKIGPREARHSWKPNFYGNEGCLPIQVQHSYLQTTTLLPHPHDDDGVLMVLEALHERVELEREGRDPAETLRPYWLYVAPGAEHTVLTTEAEAKELRRHGYLREGFDARRLLSHVSAAGVPIPSYNETWFRLRHQISDVFDRVVLIQPAGIGLQVNAIHDNFGAARQLELNVQSSDAHIVLDFPQEWNSTLSREVLNWLTHEINKLLANVGVEHRLLRVRRNLVWLPEAWIGQLVLCEPDLRGILEDGFNTSRDFPLPISYPEVSKLDALPTCKPATEIVDDERVLDHDFKCSCRADDYPDLFDEIAMFAGLNDEIRADGIAFPTRPGWYRFHVVRGEERFSLQISDQKYADVSPIVSVLNAILMENECDRRLYPFSEPPNEQGLVLASEKEAAELRAYRYISDDTDCIEEPNLPIDA